MYNKTYSKASHIRTVTFFYGDTKVTITGSYDDVSNTLKLFNLNAFYDSETQGSILIANMDTKHIRNALAKLMREQAYDYLNYINDTVYSLFGCGYPEAIKSLPRERFIGFAEYLLNNGNIESRESEFKALLNEYKQRKDE